MSQTTVKRVKSPKVIYVNAEGQIIGRMGSKIAKLLINGEEVIILNAEKAIFSGKKKSKVAEGHLFLEVGAPARGPFHYRRPDRYLRKTVRGMLPFKQPKGQTAYKRLKVFMGVPAEYRDKTMVSFPDAQSSDLKGPRFTLGEFATEIGWKNRME
ncbi:MAG: 50S ribosomal protein L13 [Nitrososphaerota archaeon]|jgi:large subunit ribosomal protein L13|uniref:50S ribosomal protein L13 n=1 Tax=Candidatus Bathycorpusculum sp. TaxID=2994959 RepID=UPI0028332650|nr:50S ribosomal protein L13 [Candidatus Termitimicrobium sp.]MCL2432367.1 50S ribosomal protein L13 [Candidatus Termitimicrobium sp.]MDR0492697.1 50S ribosomal protein L13 [Nitrososphaerota archaeon]